MKCAGCDKELTSDEQGLSRKLINRGTTTMYCLDCLGQMFRLPVRQLQELIEHFREAGCTLFR